MSSTQRFRSTHRTLTTAEKKAWTLNQKARQAVIDAHPRAEAGGFMVHDYSNDGRCRVLGCDVYDASEDDSRGFSGSDY